MVTSVRKQLSANDLGFTGGHQSGILVPKDPAVLSFFPALPGEEVVNPDTTVHFWVPALGQYRVARFVFYNTRNHGLGTRSEYRLTRIAAMLRDLQASVGDQLVFTRTVDGTVEVSLEVAAQEAQSERVLKNGWIMSIEDEE